jgi:hypothetical protein
LRILGIVLESCIANTIPITRFIPYQLDLNGESAQLLCAQILLFVHEATNRQMKMDCF